MGDLKERFGEGLGKIQGGIDTGKKKLEATKELYNLRKTLKELMGEKGRLYFRMGQRAHLLFRQGAVQDDNLNALSGEMAELDGKILGINREIAAVSAEGGIVSCPKCGERLDADARFCISCGTPVEGQNESGEGLRACPHCTVGIPAGARYCPYCGQPAGGAE